MKVLAAECQAQAVAEKSRVITAHHVRAVRKVLLQYSMCVCVCDDFYVDFLICSLSLCLSVFLLLFAITLLAVTQKRMMSQNYHYLCLQVVFRKLRG